MIARRRGPPELSRAWSASVSGLPPIADNGAKPMLGRSATEPRMARLGRELKILAPASSPDRGPRRRDERRDENSGRDDGGGEGVIGLAMCPIDVSS